MILIEFIFSSINYFAGINKKNHPDIRLNSEIFEDTDWANEYFDEFREANEAHWESYTYWKRNPYKGKYINIDSLGNRYTSNTSHNTANPDNSLIKVFVFGGSTIWGTGSRDNHTIPSELSKLFNSSNISVQITNFGESGYISTQELLALIKEIHKNNIPDFVISYSGFNDCYSAYQQNVAGIPQNERNRITEFNLSAPNNQKKLRYLFFKRSFINLNVYKFSSYIKNSFIHRLNKNRNNKIKYDPEIEKTIVDIYFKNINIINSLGKTYNFKTAFFWQPALFTKSNLSENEKYWVEKNKEFEELYIKTTLLVDVCNLKSDVKTINLAYSFQDSIQPIYIDFCHLSEYGNKIIASKIYNNVVQTYYSDKNSK